MLGNLFASTRKILLPVSPFLSFLTRAIDYQLRETSDRQNKESAAYTDTMRRGFSRLSSAPSFTAKKRSTKGNTEASKPRANSFRDSKTSTSSDSGERSSGSTRTYNATHAATPKTYVVQYEGERSSTGSSGEAGKEKRVDSSNEESSVQSSQGSTSGGTRRTTTDKILLQLIIFASNLVHHGGDLTPAGYSSSTSSSVSPLSKSASSTEATRPVARKYDKGKEAEREGEEWIDEWAIDKYALQEVTSPEMTEKRKRTRKERTKATDEAEAETISQAPATYAEREGEREGSLAEQLLPLMQQLAALASHPDSNIARAANFCLCNWPTTTPR